MPTKENSTEIVAETQQSDGDYQPLTSADPVTEKPSAIFGSVAAVMRALAIEGIGKNQKVTSGATYSFRGIDDILNILAGLFVKNNILVRPRYGDRVLAEYASRSGGRMASVTVAGIFQLISTVDGSALEFGPFYGEGMDSGDKATNKAMAICFKYFAIQSFVIPLVGSDDPDFEVHEVQGKTVVKAQQPVAPAPPAELALSVDTAIKQLAPAGPKRKKLVDLITKAYSVVLPEQVPDDKRAEAISKLEAYVKKQAEAAATKQAA